MSKPNADRTARIAEAKTLAAASKNNVAAIAFGRLENARAAVIRSGIDAFSHVVWHGITGEGVAESGRLVLDVVAALVGGGDDFGAVFNGLSRERRANVVDYALTILAVRCECATAYTMPARLARLHEVLAA